LHALELSRERCSSSRYLGIYINAAAIRDTTNKTSKVAISFFQNKM
jgi:hypothetical protein